APKETKEQQKGKNLHIIEKEGIQNQGIGNQNRKYLDQPKVWQGVQKQGIWIPNQSQKERFDKSVQGVAGKIVGNVLKTTPPLFGDRRAFREGYGNL
ncbi:unnamed protein product, partial [Ilex paraguariensis]